MIYILEDDPGIRELVIYALESQGMEIHGFELPSQFWNAMKEQTPELILLDIMLPEEDGLSVLRKLRSDGRTHSVPVILLTAKNTEFDKVTGLDFGADDYVSKPFGMMELLARIRAVLRRTGKKVQTDEYQVGELCLSEKRHDVTVNGFQVLLTCKEFDLLCLLMANTGQVLTREQLLERVWGDDYARENRTLDVHIRTLRVKLGSAGDKIRTVRGIGYKIEAEP